MKAKTRIPSVTKKDVAAILKELRRLQGRPACCAKLVWNGWWEVRYVTQKAKVIHRHLKAATYDDAFEEANLVLPHDPRFDWIIA